MPRPFRFEPPAVPPGVLGRPALDAVLARRRDVRLVTVVAGAGFGKTMALARALAGDGTARDRWLSCVPADRERWHLLQGIATACGSPAADLAELIDRLWAETPTQISLVLDDVHEITRGSDGADLLQELLTEAPANVHFVLASRDPVPVSTSRLAAGGQLLRIGEQDLRFDADELEVIARRNGVSIDLLTPTGGWPALTELTLTAGSDLVLDYLWEEVLGGLDDRAPLLARFCVAGGGDDEIASALAGRPCSVDELVAAVPLVVRTVAGGAALHSLWDPPLRRLLTDEQVVEARIAAAGVHRRAGRPGEAIKLLAEAGAWEEVLAVVRDVAINPSGEVSSVDFGTWYRLLPAAWRTHPVALLARGRDQKSRAVTEALESLRAAETGFRSIGDVEAEVAALAFHGVTIWRMNDLHDMLIVHGRIVELAATGSVGAGYLERIGVAAGAHLRGNSAAVLAALGPVDPLALPDWGPVIAWLLTVAYRRDGQLHKAIAVAADMPEGGWPGEYAEHFEQANLRVAWLAGDVDHVLHGLPELEQRYLAGGDHFNVAGTAIELAHKQAWLGAPDDAAATLAAWSHLDPDTSPLGRTTVAITLAAIAVARGDEALAAEAVREPATSMIGRPEGWYWRDRGALALVHVLVPETRPAWAEEPLGAPHRVGLGLAQVLEAARDGDLGPVAKMDWPSAGEVRCHLPVPWIAELIAAAHAAGAPAPEELVDQVGPVLRDALRRVGATSEGAVASAAGKLVETVPARPSHQIEIDVLGPVEVRRDGASATDPEIRRRRVRELLCLLALERRLRREVIVDRLWPDLDDGARNLRVTLSYLQRVLEPTRHRGDPPFFVRADATWLTLHPSDRLGIDLWRFDDLIDRAEAADSEGRAGEALSDYLEAIPLVTGDPLVDVVYCSWAVPHRARITARHTRSAVRAAELLLAGGDPRAACDAAVRALSVDRYAEPAYDVLARAHLAAGDGPAATSTAEAHRSAMAELGIAVPAGLTASTSTM